MKTTFDLRFVSVVRGIGSLLVFGGFAAGAYILSNEITRYVLEQPKIGLFLFHRFISMMLFVFFVSVNLGNIIVSYATLYRSPEVAFLLTKPVAYPTIFILKFLDNFLYSSTTLFLVAFMVLLGYGSYFGYPWYLMTGIMVLLLIPFMLLSACIAVLILMGLMKIAGKIGFRRVMTLLSALYLLMVYLFFKFSNPIRLIEETARYYPNVDINLARLDPFFAQFLPSHWLAEFLFFLSRGEVERGIPMALLLVLVTAAMVVLVLLVAHRFYYKSWLITFQVQAESNIPQKKDSVRFFDFRKDSILPMQIESLLKKEYFTFFREPSQWIHLGVMIVLITVFVSSIRGLNFILRVADLPALTYLVLFAFGGFLASSLSLRFVFPLTSLEGRSFWAIRSMPVKLRTYFLSKFLVGFFAVTILAVVVFWFSNLPFSRLTPGNRVLLWFGLYNAVALSLTMAALNMGLGGYFANFQEKNPIRIASSQGATLTFLITLVYLILLVAIITIPITGHFDAIFYGRFFPPGRMMPPALLLAAISAFLTSFGLVVGYRSLKRDF
jgi:ABC-2 type transport system permease protein